MELIFNNLEVVWFILITVLFAGFFLLEGFDYGTKKRRQDYGINF